MCLQLNKTGNSNIITCNNLFKLLKTANYDYITASITHIAVSMMLFLEMNTSTKRQPEVKDYFDYRCRKKQL